MAVVRPIIRSRDRRTRASNLAYEALQGGLTRGFVAEGLFDRFWHRALQTPVYARSPSRVTQKTKGWLLKSAASSFMELPAQRPDYRVDEGTEWAVSRQPG